MRAAPDVLIAAPSRCSHAGGVERHAQPPRAFDGLRIWKVSVRDGEAPIRN
jgi:hypothetical protein